MTFELLVSVIVPRRGSAPRLALPSNGSLRRGSPSSAVLRLAPTPRCPSRRASFPSLGSTSDAPIYFAGAGGCALPAGQFGLPASAQFRGESRSPRFPGSPLVRAPCSPTPARTTSPSPLRRCRYCLPRFPPRRPSQLFRFRGSFTQLTHSLSTLRSRGRPQTTQDSLPAGRLPLTGRDWIPAGLQKRFQVYISTSTRLCLAHGKGKKESQVLRPWRTTPATKCPGGRWSTLRQASSRPAISGRASRSSVIGASPGGHLNQIVTLRVPQASRRLADLLDHVQRSGLRCLA